MDVTVWCLICAVGALTSAGSGQAFQLPHPQNVTVDCDNFKTFVYWNYSKHLVDPVFELKIENDLDDSKGIWHTVDDYADITGHLNDTRRAIFSIQIQANNGTHTSEYSPFVTFTFSQEEADKAGTLCKLDFPPATVEYQYAELTLSFQNPLHLYKDTPALEYLSSNTYPTLSDQQLDYTVIYQNVTEDFTCTYDEKKCKKKMPISDKKDRYCVSLAKGMIYPARRYFHAATVCTGRKKGDLPLSVIIIIAFLLLLAVTAAVLGILACWKKIKTPPRFPPYSLTFEKSPQATFVQVRPESLSNPSCVTVDLTPSETSDDPLLPDQTPDSCQDNDSSCSHLFFGPDHIAKEEQYGYGSKDPEYPTDPELIQETSGETLSSDYDSPHGIVMEWDPEDCDDGYTARERLA